MFRKLDEREAGQVIAWRPPALNAARPSDATDGAGETGETGETQQAPSAAVTVHSNEQLASMVAAELEADDADAGTVDTEADALPDGGSSSDAPSSLTSDRFDEGYQAGFDAGGLDARASLGEGLRTVVEGFGTEHEHWRATREREIVSLASALAAAILRRELVDDPASLERLVGETLAAFDGDAPPPVVQLHPLDLEVVGLTGQDGGRVELLADPSLQRGDCRIRSGASLIEAGVAERLAALLADEAA